MKEKKVSWQELVVLTVFLFVIPTSIAVAANINHYNDLYSLEGSNGSGALLIIGTADTGTPPPATPTPQPATKTPSSIATATFTPTPTYTPSPTASSTSTPYPPIGPPLNPLVTWDVIGGKCTNIVASWEQNPDWLTVFPGEDPAVYQIFENGVFMGPIEPTTPRTYYSSALTLNHNANARFAVKPLFVGLYDTDVFIIDVTVDCLEPGTATVTPQPATPTMSSTPTPSSTPAGVSLYVKPGGDDALDCQSPASACATINGAIGKATSGGTIFVAAGIYTSTETEVVLIDKSLTIIGGWDTAFSNQTGTTIIDGENARIGISVWDKLLTTTIDHITVQNGNPRGIGNSGKMTLKNCEIRNNNNPDSSGAGIFTERGEYIVQNCDIHSNTAYTHGGGIYVYYGKITITDSRIYNNETIRTYGNLAMGGGVFIDTTYPVTITNSEIYGNTSHTYGGGIHIQNSRSTPPFTPVDIVDTSIFNNIGDTGGGLSGLNVDFTIDRSAIYNNIATGDYADGGGISLKGGGMTLINSTISANEAVSMGGGIYSLANSPVVINNSTIAFNVALYTGGIYHGSTLTLVTLQNSILSNNSGGDCDSSSLTSNGYNIIGNTANCSITQTTGDLFNIDPNLKPLGDYGGSTYTHALESDSPAIDAGNPSTPGSGGGACEPIDQRGIARPIDGDNDGNSYCDIGSFENPLPPPSICSTQTSIPQLECEALETFYNSTNGAGWTNNTGWLSDPDPCVWYGVTCTTGHVTNLNLYTNLSGTIPPEIGNLTALIELELSNNQLSGSIPAEIGNLNNLETLHLHNNQLSGSIPASLGNLSSLQILALSGNYLSGEIPAELGSLANLTGLHLAKNYLSGSIPPEVANLSVLERLSLEHNGLTGTIPAELGTLTNLIGIGVENNQMSGSIPPELGNLIYLQFLYLSQNDFSGNLPAELGNLTNLIQLYIDNNPNLSGPLPASLTNLTSLPAFHYDMTNLCEPQDAAFQVWLTALPDRVGTGVACETAPVCYPLTLSHTGSGADPTASPLYSTGCAVGEYISGEVISLTAGAYAGYIVSGWSGTDNDASRLTTNTVTMPDSAHTAGVDYADPINCAVQTSIPKTECEALVALYNSTNGAGWKNSTGWLSDPDPCTWYEVTCTTGHVTTLDLYGNTLIGTIPPELENLTNLVKLNLGYNQLSGTIPPGIAKLTVLQYAYLYSNQLSGNIPAEIGNLGSLKSLDLEVNQLSGSIPPSLGNLNNLENLRLDSNQLSGSIPVELCFLPRLMVLYLGNNQLSGSIPPELGNLTALRQLSLHTNQLSGSIPPELGDISTLLFLDVGNNQLSGSIPPELGNLTALTQLSVHTNQLSGSIPPELGNLTALMHLSLHTNQLSGSIPPELGNLTALTHLFLHTNQLSGSILPELGDISTLFYLDVGNNQLSGSIPPELGDISTLLHLDVANNQLSGNIPVEIGNLTNLTDLSLSGNNFHGSIPPEIGNLTHLYRLNIGADYLLTGPLPATMTQLLNLYDFTYHISNLCEPQDAAFQAWLTAILELKGTGIACADVDLGISIDDGQTSVKPGGPISYTITVSNAGPGDVVGAVVSNVIPADLIAPSWTCTASAGASCTAGPVAGGIDDTVTIPGGGTLTYTLNATVSASATGTLSNTASVSIPATINAIDGNPANDSASDSTDVWADTCAVQTSIPQSECDALVSLYHSTNGDTWTHNTGWLADPDPCAWFGISCTAGNVSVIRLKSNNLTGPLPPEIGGLVNLGLLYLPYNQLNGSLPLAVGDLSSLTTLNLFSNQLSGSIPTQLATLTGLLNLDLGSNQFSGGIPVELGDLTGLRTLSLSNNQLSGIIPAELGGLSKLTHLKLLGNQLSGSIPAELGSLTSLQYLLLHENQLSGTLPPELGNLTALWWLYLSNNPGLSGGLPLELQNLTALTSFYYRDTGLCEPQDAGIQAWLNGLSLKVGTGVACPDCYTLSVSHTGSGADPAAAPLNSVGCASGEYFSGEVIGLTAAPDTGFTMSGWSGTDNDASTAATNTVTMPAGAHTASVDYLIDYPAYCAVQTSIPQLECESLVAFYHSTNGLNWTDNTGWLSDPDPCNWLGVSCYGSVSLGGSVQSISLGNNNLTGTLSPELGNLPNLIDLAVQQNYLSGSIPIEITNLDNLFNIYLYENALTGPVHPEFGSMPNLAFLNLWKNQLSGSIPPELGTSTSLLGLILASNQLTGSIPPELGNLTNLGDLWLNDNPLTGTIPVELSNLTNLVSLGLAGSGAVPEWVGTINSITTLYFDNSQFSGPLPFNLTNLNLAEFYYNNSSLCTPDDSAFLSWQWTISSLKTSGITCADVDLGISIDDGQTSVKPGDPLSYTITVSNGGPGDVVGAVVSNVIPADLIDPSWTCTASAGAACTAGPAAGDIQDTVMIPSDGTLIYTLNATVAATATGTLNNTASVSIPATVNAIDGNSANDSASDSTAVWADTCTVQTSIPQIECEALVSLYNSTNGDTWTNNTGWLAETDPCAWFGVTCLSGHVTDIRLGSNNLVGSLPPEIGGLPNLTLLYLPYNHMSGSLPLAVGGLSNLVTLNLFSNQLSGSIPVQLASLTGLQNLDLGSNQFSGDIPAELGDLTGLRTLSLSNNQLYGGIPAGLGGLSKLTHLKLFGNQLSGSIPAELGSLTNLQYLWLHENQLSGTLPPELGNLTALKWLYLNNNLGLSGGLPLELQNLTALTNFYYRDTGLCEPQDAGIQAWLSGLTLKVGAGVACPDCYTLSVSHTGSGADPAATPLNSVYCTAGEYSSGELITLTAAPDTGYVIGSWSGTDNDASTATTNTVTMPAGPHAASVDYLIDYPAYCAVQTSIPQLECEALVALYNSTNGDDWTRIDNWLTSPYPCSWESVMCSSGHVDKLLVYNGNLTGNIPPELGALSNLDYLDLSDNQLSGSIPPELGNLTMLTTLELGRNQLTGSIPPELGNFIRLSRLELEHNQLEMSIPPELGSVYNLSYLDLSYNSLSGSIPAELSNLHKLETLYLAYNQLSGVIPPELGDIRSLWSLHLGFNPLSGAIPPELGNLGSLQYLYLNDTQLTGPLPLTFARMYSLTKFNYINTGVCEPRDDGFQTWLARINDLNSNEIPCAYVDLSISVDDGQTSVKPSGPVTYMITVSEAGLGDVPGAVVSDPIPAGLINPSWTCTASAGATCTVGPVVGDILDTVTIPSGGTLTYTLNATVSAGAAGTLSNTARVSIPATVNAIDWYAANDSDSDSTSIWNGACEEQASIPAGECEALVALYNSTTGSGWTNNTDWLANSDLCAWFGITCLSGHVIEIRLGSNNLSGPLPPGIGGLPNLKVLYLPYNNLSGILPTEVGSLTSLVTLNIFTNQLVGVIPVQLANLTALENLDLGSNYFSRGIPREMGNLTGLRVLSLSNNKLSGTIPTTLGGLSKLTHLKLFGNWLTGSIPAELGSLTNLQYLLLHENQLSGTLPPELGGLTALKWLYLSNNLDLSGGLPLELQNLTALTNFYYRDTGLCEPQDPTFQAWLNGLSLKVGTGVACVCYPLTLSHTGGGADPSAAPLNSAGCTVGEYLSGELVSLTAAPDPGYLVSRWSGTDNDVSTLTANTVTMSDSAHTVRVNYSVDYSANCAGQTFIPQAECDALVALYNSTTGIGWTTNTGWLVENDPCAWFGVTCLAGQVSEIRLGSNNLTGPLPPEIDGLTNLTLLFLPYNHLSGSLPQEVGNLSSLVTLNLFSNQMSGSIPAQLASLTGLQNLDLGSNQFSGGIPVELESLTGLRVLNLSNNQMSGSIPTGLGGLSKLTHLKLFGNQLSGSISAALGNLTNLEYLLLHENQLSGTLPTELGNLTALKWLYLNNNPDLKWGLPLELQNLTALTNFYYRDTGLCEPDDAGLQTWLAAIPLKVGTGMSCTLVVDSTLDTNDTQPSDGICDDGTGTCTLRAAIEEVNATVWDGWRIEFNIAGTAPFTIQPLSALPEISTPVIIDGTSQPGYIGEPVIELDGINAVGADGLAVSSNNTIVRGLVINNFNHGISISDCEGVVIEGNYIGLDTDGITAAPNSSNGIYIIRSANNRIGGTDTLSRNVVSGNGRHGIYFFYDGYFNNQYNVIQGNYLGTDKTGIQKVGNTASGMYIEKASYNTIGGVEMGEGNLVSGNGSYGIVISSGSWNEIQGNFVGTDATGTANLGNGFYGIYIYNTSLNTIGGAEVGAGNLISGNGGGIGVDEYNNGGYNTIQGNYIGTNADGTAALPNRNNGISLYTDNNQIGGAALGAGNLISGNLKSGIHIGIYSTAVNNFIQGNLVGTTANGIDPLPNLEYGIWIDDDGSAIGGTNPGEGNTVAHNQLAGIRVNSTFNPIQISGNQIHNNGGLGIDLSGDGVTANDAGDATLPQNFPALSQAVDQTTSLLVEGTLNSTPYLVYTIEFFANSVCDPSGYGEGETFLGATQVTADVNGNASFSLTLPVAPAGSYITATATNTNDQTSEFSACQVVTAP